MKHNGQAIRDAAEKNGYKYRWWKVTDLEHNEGYNALRMRGLSEHLSDPSLWKALATARERHDTGAWICHWHRFIDHIALGEDTESFFSSLQQVLERRAAAPQLLKYFSEVHPFVRKPSCKRPLRRNWLIALFYRLTPVSIT